MCTLLQKNVYTTLSPREYSKYGWSRCPQRLERQPIRVLQPSSLGKKCGQIPSGTIVPWKSLLGSHVRKLQKSGGFFGHRLLWDWLTKSMPSSFASELWKHIELCRTLSFVWFGTPTSCPPCTVTGPTWPRFCVLEVHNFFWSWVY